MIRISASPCGNHNGEGLKIDLSMGVCVYSNPNFRKGLNKENNGYCMCDKSGIIIRIGLLFY